MKKFTITAAVAVIGFLGFGIIADQVGAAFRSDERAVAIVRRARAVIGGDNVRGLVIVGKSNRTLTLPDGAKNVETDVDIALEFPNRFRKEMRGTAGKGDGTPAQKVVTAETFVFSRADGQLPKDIVVKGTDNGQVITGTDEATKDIVVFRPTTESNAGSDNKRIQIVRAEHNSGPTERFPNELFRMTMSLLARSSNQDEALVYAGETSVEGSICDLVTSGEGVAAVTVCFDRSSGLPRMARFSAPKPIVFKFDKEQAPGTEQVKVIKTGVVKPELGEFEVTFSDFRTVDGVQLPFKWTQTQGGAVDEVTVISSYEVNPANLNEKFKEERKVIMLKKENK